MTTDIEKAFDFAQESTKQVLALSTAILTLTITFRADIIGTGASASAGRWALMVAWIAYLLSIVFGLSTLLNLAGNLEKPGGTAPSIYHSGIRVFSMFQIGMFAVAMIFTLVYGMFYGLKAL